MYVYTIVFEYPYRSSFQVVFGREGYRVDSCTPYKISEQLNARRLSCVSPV